MKISLPASVRYALYITIVIGTAILVPLSEAGYIPAIVMSVWTSVSAAVSLLAAFNVDTSA